MEPISAITTALVAGAAAASKDTASSLVKDAYQALKARLFGSNLQNREQLNQKIDALQATIAELQSSIAAQVNSLPDTEVAEIAKQANEVGAQIIIENSKGVQVGDNNQQTNNFS